MRAREPSCARASLPALSRAFLRSREPRAFRRSSKASFADTRDGRAYGSANKRSGRAYDSRSLTLLSGQIGFDFGPSVTLTLQSGQIGFDFGPSVTLTLQSGQIGFDCGPSVDL